ncbi:MAG TPA: thiosulfate oxidation carrier protein SoxY [Xanthobacteraceae bacterium]|jgi:sulfur-oxidizing protein SoxY
MSNDTAPDGTRRLLIKGAVAGGLAGLGVAEIGFPSQLQAADASEWPKDAFAQKTEADAVKALYGKAAEESAKVVLDAPEIAENGAVVPISVSSTLPGVSSISILVAENPFPLAASYRVPAGASAMVGSRLKMAKTSRVTALVEAGGKVYSASKEVKVTVGGCGG